MFPIMIEITTKIGCSLNCRYCPQDLLINSYYSTNNKENNIELLDIMNFKIFKECIDKIPPNIDIHFSGMCEPWQNPECTKMILYAYNKGHSIHVFTTLQGMSRDDYLKIRELDLKSFVLHIPDSEYNSKFKIDDSYLNLLREVIKDTIDGRFKISYYSCHGNVHESIKELIEFSKIPINNQMFDRAGNLHEEGIISSKEKKGQIICKWCGGNALNKNVLLPNGVVLLCCMDYGMEFPLGNLLNQKFDEISEGKTKKHYRMLLKSESLGKILCRHCHRSLETTEQDLK